MSVAGHTFGYTDDALPDACYVGISPLSNAISRYFEQQCDRYALQRTGLHRPFLSAFTKLSQLNKADPPV